MIKFVYFDIGGVVIKDFSNRPDLWSDLRKDLGITEEYWEKNCDKKLDVGIIPVNLPVPYDQLVERFVSRFEQNRKIWPVIDFAKTNFRVGLLTNMYPQMLDLIKKYRLLPKIDWEITIDSVSEKTAKPNKEIYEIAKAKTGLLADEILFIDNTQKNIDGAKTAGFQTFLYSSANYEQSSKELKSYLSKLVF